MNKNGNWWIICTAAMVLLTLSCSLMPFGRSEGREEAGVQAEEPGAVEAAPPSRDERLGETYESLEGGFSFQPVIGYQLTEFFGIVSMAPSDADPIAGPVFTLIGGLNEETKDAEQLLQDMEGGMPEGIELSRSKKITVDGIKGLTIDFEGLYDGVEVEGKAVLIAVSDTQIFNMLAMFPAGAYGRDEESLVDALLDTVRFFQPQDTGEISWDEEPLTELQEIRQWAITATASSEYSNPEWAAFQATGAPDTSECGDYQTAWASVDPSTAEWIELDYEQPVLPEEIIIYQTNAPNQVVQVELRDLSNNYHMIYLNAPQQQTCPYVLTIPVEDVDVLVDGILISIDQSVLEFPWNEIDAVELVGNAEIFAQPPSTGEGNGSSSTGPSSSGSLADISTWTWRDYTSADGLPDDNIQALAFAADDTIWIGMKNGGVAHFVHGEFTQYTTGDGIGHENVKALVVAPDGTVWAGTANGLSSYDGNTWRNYEREDGLVHDIVNALAVATDGTLWIATEAGISSYDQSGFTNYTPDEGQGRTNVKSVAVAANGDVWFATFNGISRFDGQTWSYYTIADGLSLDVYTSVGVAPDGSVWLGSSGEAADRFDGSSFTSFKDAMGPTVYVKAIATGQDGSMWFATEGDGVYRYDGQTWQQFLTGNSGLTYNWVDTIAVGPDGELWFAARKNGLLRFGP